MASREVMLARIRDAIGAAGSIRAELEVPREYLRHGDLAPGSDQVVQLLIERLVDYKAEVLEAGPDDLGEAVISALASSGRVVLPPGIPGDLPDRLAAAGLEVVLDAPPVQLTATELDAIDAVVTTATVAIAVNGTIILDAGPGQGRRIISLVPDLHVVILRRSQVVQTVPEALAQLDPVRPMTLIAGPSATSDIELSRVEGVHGPRTLRVVLVGEPRQGSAN
jgi:L-lactate dehydrogenase complex protein LldG